MSLRFLADHCVPNSITNSLKEVGHEVIRLGDCLPVNSADPEVIAKAQEIDSILMSLNGDFADIVAYPPAGYKGIAALQVRNHPETIPAIVGLLKDYTAAHPTPDHYKGRLLIVESHRIRIRL
ncbi:MAG: DUF5615 family PIN-like protein [Planctomycetota bacterium]|nr:DUF5615 family PIN-like protein [Planctomycetota bacterium]